MAFNLTNTQAHIIPHQHPTSDITWLVELIQANAVVVSPTAPANPGAGKLWYNTTKGVFNIWNWSAWILVGPEICPLTKAQYDALSAADKADGRFYLITDNDWTIYVEWENIDGRPYLISSTAPSTPAEWYLWYDTTDDVLKFYDWTNWNPVNTNTEYTGWTNVSVDPVTHEISATDTTYVAGDFDIKDLADSTGLRTTWSWKQDAINDLQTIRSWASAWATAVQPLDNVSWLTNDAWYITNAVSDLTNYYTKTQTYTKAEVDQMISDFGWFEVVEQLPAVATANPHIIYLLGPIGTWGDRYEEWIVTEDSQQQKQWTKIWETSVDLSNYFNTFTDTADSITAWSTNLFVTSSEKSTWSWKQDALVEWTGIDIDSSTNEISVDTTAIATKTDIANFFDKTSDDADDIDDTNSTNKFVTSSEKSTWSWKQDALTAWDNITISSNTISADVNTKTFPMAVATKVADAQAAIDWVLDWNNALIKLDNRIYLLDKVENWVYYFKAVAYSNNGTNDTMTVTNIEVTVVSDSVTEVHIMWEAHWYLETNRNYSTPFVPTQNWHPATKKYVDDNVIQKSAVAPSNPTEWTVWYDTTNDVLKVYNGSNWDVTWKTYTAWTNIDITNDVISADTQFVVVDTLPTVAQADVNKVYILWPIWDWADKYEEWIVSDHWEPHFVSESTIDHESIDFTYDGENYIIWNDDCAIQNKYIWITNLQLSTSNRLISVSDYGGSCYCCDIDNDSEMPFIWNGPTCDSTGWYECPEILYSDMWVGQSGETASFDLYYSDTPLTWVAWWKEWIKIWETSADLSNYLAKDNTTSYTPSWDYNPATKKYVDDRAVPTSGTTWYILTKTANGYEWAAAPSSWKYDIVTSSSEPSDHTVLWIKPWTSETSDEMYRYDDANSGWVLMWWVHKWDNMPYEDFWREWWFWLKESQDGYGPELLYYDGNADSWVNVGWTYINSYPPNSENIFWRYWFWYDTVHNELKYYDYNNSAWISLWWVANTDYVSISTPGNFFSTNSDNQIFYYEDGFWWNPIWWIIYSYSSSDVPTDKLWYDQTNDVFKYYNQSTDAWEEVTRIYTPWDGIDIDTSNNNEISVDVSDFAGTWLTDDWNNNLAVDTTVIQEKLTAWTWINISNQNVISADTTVLATKSDIAKLWSFEVVDTLPSAATADEKTIYLLWPIWTGSDKYEEWIVTEDSQQQKQWTKIWETSIDLSWYATTSAMNAALLTKADVSDLNTKTFYLTWTTWQANIDKAQAALDWYLAGKNPIIVYSDKAYILYWHQSDSIRFRSMAFSLSNHDAAVSTMLYNEIQFTIDSSTHTVTEIFAGNVALAGWQNFLATGVNYSSPYNPQYDWSPATKKYVDDNVVQKSSTAPSSYTEWTLWYDTTNDVLKVYDWTNWNEVWSWWAWDMLYADFNWSAKSWASITLDLNTTIEPTANFTVNAPATIKDWQIYVLRVQTWVDAYTMTLGTNITNPYNEDLTLSINTITQFSFVWINNKLELQPSIESASYTAWDGIDITNGTVSVDVTDIIGTWLSEDASNNIIVDTTVVAMQTDLSWKQDKATSGSATPSTTPSYVWQQYVDTTNGKLYVALWTSSSSDWMEVGAWGGNVVAITQQEYDALTPAEKNDWKFRIITDSPSETLPFVEEMDDSPTQWIKIWAGTQAQYNSLQSVDPSWVYIILSSN